MSNCLGECTADFTVVAESPLANTPSSSKSWNVVANLCGWRRTYEYMRQVEYIGLGKARIYNVLYMMTDLVYNIKDK